MFILTINQIPSHNHSSGSYNRVLRQSGQNTINTFNGSADNRSGEPDLRYSGTMTAQGGSQPHSHGFSGTASSTAISTLQPYLALFYIIKY